MKTLVIRFSLLCLLMCACTSEKVVNLRDYGVLPDTHENLSAKVQEALNAIQQEYPDVPVTVLFEPGRYDF